MSEWSPSERTRGVAQEFTKFFLGRMPVLLGVDEIITGCELLALDPFGVGVGVTPRYITVSIREFTQHVWYTGTLGLIVGDDYAVVHTRDGDRYELLGSSGTGGASGGGWVPPPGLVLGTGIANQVAYWSAVDTIAGDAGFTYDPATDTMTVGAIEVLTGGDIDPADASGQDLGDAAHRWDLYAENVIFSGASGANVTTIPDDVADAWHVVDAGGIEYLRFITTNVQPVIVWNEGGADVDTRIESVGKTHALFVRGSDGHIGVNEAAPGAMVQITTDNAATKGLIIKGVAAQAGNLQEWQDSTGAILSVVDAVGHAAFGLVAVPAGRALVAYITTSGSFGVGCGTTAFAASAVPDAFGNIGYQGGFAVTGVGNLTGAFGAVGGNVGVLAYNQSYTASVITGAVGMQSGFAFVGAGATGSITQYAGFYAVNPFNVAGATGTIGTQYGFYAPTLSFATTNWGFYAVSNPSHFGGNTSVGGTIIAAARLHVDQDAVGGTIPVAILDQADLSEEFIDFICATTGAGDPVDTVTVVGANYARLRVAVNGVFKYVQLHNA